MALDPVNHKALKGKFKDREDKDIDNDGDADSSDEYLHKRRQAVSKAIGKIKEAAETLDEVSTEKLRDYASAALQDKNKAKADKRWKYAGKAMQTVADRDVKAAHDRKYNRMEEAVQVDKKNYSWGKMITVRHGSSHSFPLHPEHQDKIKKLNDGESTAFKDETGSHVTAHREGDKVHLKLRGANQKTTVAHSHFTEEVELEEKRGLWDNIHAKRKRIEAGSGERMRKPGEKGAPSADSLKNAQSATESKTYRKPTQAEIDADRKKDEKGKPRPSISAKSVIRKTYGSMMGGLKNEEVEHITESENRDYIKTVLSRHLNHNKVAHKVSSAVGYDKFDVGNNTHISHDGVGLSVKHKGKEVAYYSKPRLDYKDAAKTALKHSMKESVEVTEAKDGDGANIVRDREFKSKPSKTIPYAKPGEPGHNTHASLFKKDGPKPAWMDRAAKMKKEEVEQIDEIQINWSHKTQKYHTIKHPDGSHWGVFDHRSYGTKGHEIRKIRDSEGNAIKASDSRKSHSSGYKSGMGSPSEAAKEWAKKHGGTITNHKIKEEVEKKPTELPADKKPLRLKLAHFRHQE